MGDSDNEELTTQIPGSESESTNSENKQRTDPITLYMRFKKELSRDHDGNLIHIDFLMDKFELEFNEQIKQSE